MTWWRARPTWQKVSLVALGVIVLLGAISGGGEEPSTTTRVEAAVTTTEEVTTTTTVPPTTVTRPLETFTAAELYGAYEANEVSADQTYGGQTVEITGTVKDIGLDLLDNPYVTLETGELWSVQCFFAEEEADAVADLAAGQEVSLIGTVDGLAVGTNLTVDDCRLS
ncbi:MAG: hypothetical protein ABR609_06005 [Acidimicrobiia bacterium]